MAGFRGPSPSPPPSPRRRPGFVRRCERCCGAAMRGFPLVLVYGLTTWAMVSQVQTCVAVRTTSWLGDPILAASFVLYALLNWCYSVAVFTDPGSPLNAPSGSSRHAYSALPTVEPPRSDADSITVKSTGGVRFCKKCQARKPDRAHHCSTCGRCVLKMDHHCPWLATCVGLRNYKAFLLFCAYVTVFCWACFATSAGFLWGEIAGGADMSRRRDLFNVNVVVLAVVAGVFGLVLAGFTAWHLSLAARNQTTIECLEKTRYLNPIRRTMDRAAHAFADGPAAGPIQRYGHQLAEIHANAIPGVTRAEEGEERPSPTQSGPQPSSAAAAALRGNYAAMERARENARYEDYMEEQESAKLPHAFDLGWRRNLLDLFGPDWRLWPLPVCNTAGDGWRWDTSPRWAAAQRDLAGSREARAREQEAREVAAGWGQPAAHRGDVPMQLMRRDDDSASTDGIYGGRDDDQDDYDDGDERVRSPRPSGDEWRDWD